jgi:hypothetical protein
MSMSFEARQRVSRWRLGPWLWLLIGQSILWPLFTLSHVDVLRQLWEMPETRPMLVAIAWSVVQSVTVGLLLLRRQAGTITLATILIGGGPPIAVALAFLVVPNWSSLRWFFESPRHLVGVIVAINMVAGLMFDMLAATGWVAYLLASPRVAELFPGTTIRAGTRDQYRGLPRRLLMIGFPIALALMALPPLLAGFAEGETQDDLARLGFASADRNGLVLIGLILLTEIVAGLLLWRSRRWRAIQTVILLLWLLAAFKVALWLVHLIEPAMPMPVAFQQMSITSAAIFAVAWTAYLLEAPSISERYRGRKRQKDRVTDVDVF